MARLPWMLGIGHHPHVAQGFGYEHGKLVAYPLGNFVFAQDRLETLVGLVAEATLKDDALTGFQARPVYLEGWPGSGGSPVVFWPSPLPTPTTSSGWRPHPAGTG